MPVRHEVTINVLHDDGTTTDEYRTVTNIDLAHIGPVIAQADHDARRKFSEFAARDITVVGVTR